MNYNLRPWARTPASWAAAQESLWYYLEEASVRKTSPKLEWVDVEGEAQPGRESPGVVGFRLKLPQPDLHRALDILFKADITTRFSLMVGSYPVLPQDDPDEKAILERLAGGKLPTRAHSVEAPVTRPHVTTTTIEVKSNPGIDKNA